MCDLLEKYFDFDLVLILVSVLKNVYEVFGNFLFWKGLCNDSRCNVYKVFKKIFLEKQCEV